MTTDCNVAEHGTGKDILSSITNAKFTITGENGENPENTNTIGTATNPAKEGQSDLTTETNSSNPSLGIKSNENVASQISSIAQKKVKVAGYTTSYSVLFWVLIDFVLIIIAVVLFIRFKRKKIR